MRLALGRASLIAPFSPISRWVSSQVDIDHVKALDAFSRARTIRPLVRTEVLLQVDVHDVQVGRSRRQSWLRNVLRVTLKDDHGAALAICAGITSLSFCSG